LADYLPEGVVMGLGIRPINDFAFRKAFASPQQLRELFPGAEFDVVNSLLLEINQQTKDKTLYDAQEKQRRDLLWLQSIAIEEAELRGEKRGEKRGTLKGKIMTLQEVLGLPLTPDLE
jgi:hypothetical protein